MKRLFLVLCALYAAIWVVAAVTLPDRVPIHFGVGGEADRVVGRTEALGTFAVIGAGLAGLLAWTASRARRSSMAFLNVPHKAWWTRTPEREDRVRAMVEQDVWVMAALTVALLDVLLVWTASVAHAEEPTAGPVLWVAVGGYLLAVAALQVHAFRTRYQPAVDDGPDDAGAVGAR